MASDRVERLVELAKPQRTPIAEVSSSAPSCSSWLEDICEQWLEFDPQPQRPMVNTARRTLFPVATGSSGDHFGDSSLDGPITEAEARVLNLEEDFLLPVPSVPPQDPSSTCQQGDPEISPRNSNGKRTRQNGSKEFSSRKRSVNLVAWKAVQRKTSLNSGQAYISTRGKNIPGKVMGPECGTFCRMKCHDKILLHQRQQIFDQFWKLSNHTRQWDFISRHIKSGLPQRVTVNLTSQRKHSRSYFFLVNGNEMKVCQTMFISTLGISQQWIRTAMRKALSTNSPNKRGKHSKKGKIIKQSVKLSIRNHIDRFPRVPSHYCRKDIQREYLEEGLSIRKMYLLYCEDMENKQCNEIATERQYRDIFNTQFNHGFFKPKKDQCDICTSWTIADSEEEKERLRVKFEAHVQNKDAARALKDEDKVEAKHNSSLCLASFDLQKVLNAPYGETSASYYKRKLAVFNFTVFDIGRKTGHCYIWHEGIGKRGSNEVGSCLLDFIEYMVNKHEVKEFRFYSDNCAGQNENRFIYALMLHASTKFQLIKLAKDGDNPYRVLDLEPGKILNLKKLVEGHNWEKDVNGNNIPWKTVREIQVNSTCSSEVKLKYNYKNIEYTSLSIHKGKGRPVNLAKFQFEKAYSEPLRIPVCKVKDLLELCDKLLIPSKYHDFYRSFLPHSTQEDQVG